jgi:predicted Rossmann fold nucleotide-binding protein DprA/Smf involved in DNA uptake
MKSDEPICITSSDARWPRLLAEHGDESTPPKLWALGNLDILSQPKTALFCSTRCPGDAILRAYDQAVHWRNMGRCIVSGFHSPVEKECLQILLRGKQSIIISPARGLEKIRLAEGWQKPLTNGQLLIISRFTGRDRRVTSALAVRRNEFVAALADEVWFAHIAPGGENGHDTVARARRKQASMGPRLHGRGKGRCLKTPSKQITMLQ